MTINTYILDAAKTLDPYKGQLEKIATDAIKQTISILPVEDVDIVLYDNPNEAIEHIALGGYTPNAHLIFLSLNPQKENFADLMKKHLGRQLAHELHHALRWRNPGYGYTLLEAMVTEGLADHFMYELYPGELEEWDKKEILGDRMGEVTLLAKDEYNSDAYNHAEWFLGSNVQRLPLWAGYALGHHLVGEYLKKRPGQTASTLYATPAEEFIK